LSNRGRQQAIGDALAHPAALAALAVLAVNDHWAKGRLPGWLTGKASDVAGMVFFPLVLWALIELGLRAFGQRERRPHHLYVSVAATAVVFAATNLSELAGGAYAWALAALQWPFRAALHGELIALSPVAHVVDPTDLVALPALAVALWIGRRYLS
jgi:hypothetical protein